MCLCIFSGVQNLKHSEATFTLFSPSFSPCQTHSCSWQSLLMLLPNVMLLPCIRAPLDGQFDLLGDERRPCVAGGDYLRTRPFFSLHAVPLEARRRPAPLRGTQCGLHGGHSCPCKSRALCVQVETALTPWVLYRGPTSSGGGFSVSNNR